MYAEKCQLTAIARTALNVSPLTPAAHLHTEKYFRNIIKSNRNQIVFTIFQ